MFINSKKCFEVCEGGQKFVIPRDYIGNIPDWAAKHWLVQAAIKDGSIATPGNTADQALEAADAEAAEKSEEYDQRPDGGREIAATEPQKQPVGSRKA